MNTETMSPDLLVKLQALAKEMIDDGDHYVLNYGEKLSTLVFEKTDARHPDHDCSTCEYGMDNAYDATSCEVCDFCMGHGFIGHSW